MGTSVSITCISNSITFSDIKWSVRNEYETATSYIYIQGSLVSNTNGLYNIYNTNDNSGYIKSVLTVNNKGATGLSQYYFESGSSSTYAASIEFVRHCL